jgi:hypothetical protein
VAEEERNPGPIPSWNHERWEFDDHPLQRFGWPEESLPDLEAVKNNVVVNTAVAIKWTERTKSEFEAEKIKAGSFEAAGKLHGVSRTRYTKIYKQITGSTKSNPNATGLHGWTQLGARKK